MMDGPAAADSLVLIAGPGPELFAAIFVLIVGLAGCAVSILMSRGNRAGGWLLLVTFALLATAAIFVLTHVPTRLVLGRSGAAVAFWSVQDRRGWDELPIVTVRRGPLGLWIGFTDRRGGWLSPWSNWPGLFVPHAQSEPRALALRIDGWRAAGARDELPLKR